MKTIVRWEAKRIGPHTTEYALRTAARGKGKEIGAYSSWDNPRAEEASEAIALAIEKKARELGYILGDDSWNDLE